MPDHTDGHIGARLQALRKTAGLTQRELARASGVSVSTIRNLEQGTQSEPRLATARKLAVALRVSTSRLVDSGDARPDEAGADQWAQVRVALTGPIAQPAEEPTVHGVRAALAAARALRDKGRFAALAEVLPALVRDAEALPQEGRRARVEVLQLAGWMLTQTRQYGAADVALSRALDSAVDRQDAAATVNGQLWLLLRQGRLSETRALAERWADDIEPRWSRATASELAAWGWMLLRLSAAAVRDAREDQAQDALRLARSAAVALGRDQYVEGDYPRVFGPQKVARARVEHFAVSDQPDRVLALAEHMPQEVTNATRRSRLDVAWAHAQTKDATGAAAILAEIHGTYPEWLRQQRYARDIVSGIVARRRTLTPEMRGLASAVGL
ncbi:helix-turn-helix domain-containing protein [Streptomyces sp. NPDC049879]|uniref:helix-turn-helix domain-containing protein n=1 Tax=Streptomyces sp. NPDC049879 TaxID=3365598 RepID=UPI0037BA302B